MAATIKDIKEKTGLSLATISKYLNGGNVLPENRVSIENAIRELHYEVNEIARGLVTNRTKTIGVIVYSIESLFNGTLLRYIGDVLQKEGYGILICDSRNDEKTEKENVKFLINKKVEGIIIIPISQKADFLKPAEIADVPVVLIDRPLPDSEFDCVKIDNRKAAVRAVNVLISKGHKDIAVICSDEHEYTGYERYKGYVDALTKAELEIKPEYEQKGRHSIEHGYDSMKKLLKLKNRPTAVFMSNYEITLGAVMAVNESEYKCPEDISLIGFDDLILSHLVQPKMYMVVQPMMEMGVKAVQLLLNRIRSKNKDEIFPAEVILGTRIVEGNSISELA